MTKVDCVNAEDLVDVAFVTVGDIVIEVGVYSSSVYGAVFRALTPQGSCWTTLQEAVDEVAPSPDTFPLLITAQAIPNGVATEVQISFMINGVAKWTPYAESLEVGSYRLVFPQTLMFGGVTYTILGSNDFTVNHPQNGDTSFKASYFAELPPPPVRARFNTSEGGMVDWGEGPKTFGSILVDAGTQIEVTALPSEGFVFNFWSKNGVKVGSQNPKTFTIDRDETLIDAFFKVPTPPPPIDKWLLLIAVGGLGLFFLMRGGKQVIVVRG